MKKILLVFVCVIISFCYLAADDGITPLSALREDLIPETPHAWKIREATMPTPALLTGAVEFEVPIYTLEVDGLSFPFVLKYRSNGIRVEDDPFPCGYGWSLLPALSVTRIIRGRPDNWFPRYSDQHYCDDYELGFKCMCDSGAKNIWQIMPDRRWDAEHDIFTVRLPDKTLTLMYDYMTKKFWGVNCDEYRVEFQDDFSEIRVTDPRGYIYLFTSENGEYYRDELFRTEWLLWGVEAPCGDVIASFQWRLRDYENRHLPYISSTTIPYDKGFEIGVSSASSVVSDGGYHGVSDLVHVAANGISISFKYSDNGESYHMLTDIEVNAGGKPGCKVHLTYKANDDQMLASVNHSTYGKYTFEYNDKSFPGLYKSSYKGVPSQDWWGFYNGSTQHTGFDRVSPKLSFHIPGEKIAYDVPGADRSVNTEAMKAGIITKATLPTGGIIEWTYEAHRFNELSTSGDHKKYDEFSDTKLSEGGGLRVTSVTMTEPTTGTSQVRTYKYGKGGDGKANCKEAPVLSSFLSHKRVVGYYWSKYSQLSLPISYVHEYGEYEVARQSRANSCRPGELPIWYSEVTEICDEGKTVSYFDALYDENYVRHYQYFDTPGNITTIFSQGPLLIKKETYKSSGTGYDKVQTEEYAYETVKLNPITDMSIKRRKVQYQSDVTAPDFSSKIPFTFPGAIPMYEQWDFHPNSDTYSDLSDAYWCEEYYITPQTERLIGQSTTLHTDNGDYTTSNTYSYVNGTSLLSRVDYSTSDDKPYYIEAEYVPSGNIGDKMREYNIIGVPTLTKENYGLSQNFSRIDMYHNGERMILPGSFYSGRGASNHKIADYRHDMFGNVEEMRSCDGRIISYLYGHNGLVPVYKIEGKGIAELKAAYGQKIEFGQSESLTISENTSAVQTTKIEWLPKVGPTAITTPTGVRSTFTYDSDGRLTQTAIDNHGVVSTNAYLINFLGRNYIDSRTYLDGNGVNKIRTVDNYDGLGRVWNSVTETSVGSTAILQEYDNMGRPCSTWRPVATSNVHPQSEDLQSAAVQFYDDSNPYSVTGYELSPRRMEESSLREGAQWHDGDHSRKTRITTNRASRREFCPRYEVIEGGIEYKGRYEAGKLLIEETTDEDGHFVQKYTDMRGNIVMTSYGKGNSSISTCYIYDDYGDLRYVLPPNAADKTYYDTDDVLAQNSFRYHYDDRGNVVYRKMPGRDAIRYRYDSAGRLIGEQDALTSPNWQIYLYDKLGREVVHALVDWNEATWAAFAASPRAMVANAQDDSIGYVCEGYDMQPLKEIFTQRKYNSRGLLMLELAGDVTKLFGYDALGRVSQTIEIYPTDTLTVDLTYTYTGKVAQKTAEWSSDVPKTITEYTYDGADRLVKTTVTNAETYAQHTVSTSYDAIGQISSVKMDDVVTRDMTYDVHGWIRKIKTEITRKKLQIDPKPVLPLDSLKIQFRKPVAEEFESIDLSEDLKPSLASYSLTEELKYAEGKTPRYNGNISSRILPEGRYDFAYDAYNRLTNANYSDMQGRNYSAGYNYGADSKVSYISREGIIDRVGTNDIYGLHTYLYYTYTGRKLTGLGSGANGVNYEGRTGLPTDGDWSLDYDANGNLIYDESHNITSVRYNHFNQPETICFGDGSRIENRYTSDGLKWKSTFISTDSTRTETRYIGNAIIRDDKLAMLRVDGGYIDGGGWMHYYVTDYQGNITRTVSSFGYEQQVINYYPDGEPWIEPTGSNPFMFGGKERITFGGLRQYDFGARILNTTVGAWWQQDPKAEDYLDISPYSYCAGDPVNRVDPTGCVPIYNTQGELIAASDSGLQGTPIIINESDGYDYRHMTDEELHKINLGENGLVDKDAVKRYKESVGALSDRPDWDGYITLEEANDWYKNGNGKPLFANLRKIDLSWLYSLGENYVGQRENINLFFASGSFTDPLVYGTITLVRYPNHGVRAIDDIYDFDMHASYSPPEIIRNILTIIGGVVAGSGTAYHIKFYGTAKLKPIAPWIE